MDEARGDTAALGPDTLVVTVHGHRALIRDDAPVCVRLEDLSPTPDGLVLLGDQDGDRYAARAVADTEVEALESETGGRFEGLRTVAAGLPSWQAGILYYAAGLLAWHARSQHCGVCGAPTRSAHAGHRRECTAEGCGDVQFPRTDPAIITLVRRGTRCLLARQRSWPPGRYSTLAGFVEPGESLEQAVVREVAEETGLRVERTEYFGSQPWPFPHTIMIGFRTWVGPGDMTLGGELEAARWFDRDALEKALAGGEVTIPPPFAVSRSLIEDWLDG
jgi:NAD+ diphosphatase